MINYIKSTLLAFALLASNISFGQNDATNFTLKNSDGTEISLTDFKGKVIYVDVWATYCRWCLAEMPKSQKLLEKLEGEDIVFVYVSVDKLESSWKKMIEKKNWTGIHLISPAGQKDNFGERFKVESLPRYMIIGKNGELLDSNAPRPSDKNTLGILKSYIDKN